MSGARGPRDGGFRFGVATDGYSVEGGHNGWGEPSNNWVWWERTGRVRWPGVPGTFFAAPEPVLDRVADLGCSVFGLSAEWSRIEPEPGVLDHEALDRYAAIVAACADRGLEPIVSLHHFTHPWWLGEEFWLTPGSPERFAAHAATVVGALGDHCRTWVPVVDPARLAHDGWVSGAFPPGRRLAVSDAYAVFDNLLCAHVLAARAIRSVQPGAEVVLRLEAAAHYERGPLAADLLAGDLPADGSPGSAPTSLMGDARIAARRRAFYRRIPPRGAGDLAARTLSAALCPFGADDPGSHPGRRTAPLDGLWRGLRRPSPRRVLGLAVAATSTSTSHSPDPLWLSWEGTGLDLDTACLAADAARTTPPARRWVSGDLRQAGAAVAASRSGAPLAGFLLQAGVVEGSGRFAPPHRRGALDRGQAYGRLVAGAGGAAPTAPAAPDPGEQ